MRNLAPLFLALLSACASFTTLHTARPVKDGEMKLGAAVTATRLPAEFFEEGITPSFELYGRMGLSDASDLGLKIHPAGLMLDANFMVWDQETMALSVDPTLGLALYDWNTSPSTYGSLWLPVLFDMELGGPGRVLTASARIGTLLYYGPEIGQGGGGGMLDIAAPDPVLFGLGAAYRLPVGPVVLAPELLLVVGGEVLTYNVAVGVEYGG